jgi:hypothetical protein
MSAALTRYANPAATIGHAGPCAPIHSDERIALADLPRLADSPQAAADGFRAALLQRDREQMERANRLLRESLADVLKLAGRAARTPADDAVIERATRVLELGGLLA